VRIHQRLKAFKSFLVLQVHDQLIAECPKEEVEEVIALMKEEMEKPVEIHGITRYFPTDVEVGDSWGELKEITV
jgi:DNA polymerase-1